MSVAKEGDVILIKIGYKVYATVPKHFLYDNCRGDWGLAHGLVTVVGQFEYLEGEYIVTKTHFGGGGTAHGPGDVYPDGHHVWCCKSDNHKQRVDFYQSGSFTAVNKDVEVIGQATQTWSVEG